MNHKTAHQMCAKKLSALLMIPLLLLTGCSTLGGSDLELRALMLKEEQARKNAGDEAVPISSEARYFFLRGEIAANQERYEEAQEYFSKAASLEQAPAPFLRRRQAQMLLRQGKLREALTEIERAGAAAESQPDFLELKAGILASLKETAEAIATYQKVIEMPGSSAREDSYILLASLLAESGKPQEATTVLKSLISRSPDTVFGRYYLARILETSGDLASAESFYREALTRSPNADSIKLDLARLMGLQKRFSDGAKICEEILRDSPGNASAKHLLAQLLLGQNKVEEALKQLESIKSSAGDTTEARLKIALIKLERRDFAGAESELTLLLSNTPESGAARYYLALAFSGQGRNREAVEEIKKMSPSQQFYKESRLLGTFLMRQEKRFKEALEFLQGMIPAETTEPRLLNLLVAAQRDAGEFEAAIATTNKMIALNPTSDQLYFGLGVLLDSASRRNEAIQAMERAITLNPKNSAALNYLGYTFAELGVRLPEAEQFIHRALEQEPSNGYYVDSLGWVYFKSGRLQEALKKLEQANALVPNDSVLLEHLAILLQQTGARAKALSVAQTALKHVASSDDQGVEGRLRALIATLEQSETLSTAPTIKKRPADGKTTVQNAVVPQ